EARLSQRLRTDPGDGPDVDRLENREDAHSGAIEKRSAEVHRLTVEQHQVNLDVRYAQSLDRVLHRGTPEERMLERDAPSARGQKVIELGVKAESGARQIQ